MDTLSNVPQFSMSGWFPNGQRVFFTVPFAPAQLENAYQLALDFSNRLLAQGLLLTEPGLEAGEDRIEIGWVLRCAKSNGEPRLYLYPKNEKWAHPYVSFYPDKGSDWLMLESLTGLKATDLMLFDGESHIERGKNADKDAKYLIPVKKTVFAVREKNPAYNPDEPDTKKKKAQWKFVRLENPTAPSQPNTPPVASASAQNAPPAPVAVIPPESAETPQNKPSTPVNGKVKSDTDKINHVWKHGDAHEWDVISMTTKERREGDPTAGFTYALKTANATMIWAFNRDYFRDVWQISVDGWNRPGFHLDFPAPIPTWAVYCKNSDPNKPDYWKLDEAHAKMPADAMEATG